MCFANAGLATVLENVVEEIRRGSMGTEQARTVLIDIHTTLRQWEEQLSNIETEGPGASLSGATAEALQQWSQAVMVLDQWLTCPAYDLVEEAFALVHRAHQQLAEAHLQTSTLVEQMLDDQA